MSRVFQSADKLADALIAAVGKNLVVGLPIGIGKAIHIVDALYERALNDSNITLTIFTGLTLEKPRASGHLEQRLIEPLVERLYPDWPEPAYAGAVRTGTLPENIRVSAFYLRPGAYLGNPGMQQSYASINYSHVVGELLELGVNVIANLISERAESPGHYSLSCNPEITLDLVPHFDAMRAKNQRVAVVGQVNRNLPYMLGDAEVRKERFDFVLDSNALDFSLFGLPNRAVSPADYAIAMHVASLVRDGGTLQIGIGSLSDAVAHCLILRHTRPDVFADLLQRLPGRAKKTECEPFKKGLFASTELMSDALFELFEAGLINRPADANDTTRIHAGFFVGSSNLYARLNALDEDRRAQINMTSISNVNTLFGDEARKRTQRRCGSFINETMMVTLLGAAVSDALEDGRVVSGVGGQFDFVSMAHSLRDAQSILMVRATRTSNGVARSNIRWSYGHTTVPRHHRDVYVSEFGVAETRGRTDAEVIDAMIHIADAEFQNDLVRKARQAGKLAIGYKLASAGNTAQAIEGIFNNDSFRDFFPRYPLGTDLTQTEQDLAAALLWLREKTARPFANAGELLRAIMQRTDNDFGPAMERMKLAKPNDFKSRITRRLLKYALENTRS